MARLIWVPLALIGAVFAVANREKVVVSLWPLPWEASLPLFMVMLLVLFVGLVLGGTIVWLGGHRYRATARQQTRSNESLRRQVAELKAAPPSLPASLPPSLPSSLPPPAASGPALPPR
ncbi:MAG: lipopolysaccharide assembly protein LapA domain-containing protein [Reyranellaceae bacterium]